MIDDLLSSKKISQEDYDLYVLFQTTELGRKCLDKMTYEAFMDEPNDKEYCEVGFAFYDGRRSVFRDIHRAIKFVEDKLRNDNNG